MRTNKSTYFKWMGIVVSFFVLGTIFYFLATKNLENTTAHNYNTNFFTFWGTGHLVVRGENPYDSAQYLANFVRYGITWKPDKIFPYPLPLALLLAPLGLLPLPIAFLTAQFITQIVISVVAYVFLKHWRTPSHERLFVPLVIFLLFFGPTILTLKTGAISALALLLIFAAIQMFEWDKSFAAGMILAVTILKPPQGVTLLFLTGIWLLARRDWRAILGIATGGFTLLIIGIVQDPLWVTKFMSAGEAVFDRTEGILSNVWTLAYLSCNGTSPCSLLLGTFCSLALLGLTGYFLWTNQSQLSAWEAFNLIIPIGFASTIYLRLYDQMPYVIPIVWIVGSLVQRTKSYFYAFLFLIALDLFSLYSIIQIGVTGNDLWGLGTTTIILVMVLSLWIGKKERSTDQPTHLNPAPLTGTGQEAEI